MTRQLRVGVVGYGYWGPNLARNFSALAGSTVSAVADLSQERRARAASQFPGLRTSADGIDVVRDPDIDAVVIATPTSSHFDLARIAIEQGKHVLVTKPLTETLDQAVCLKALATERCVTVLVDHTFVYSGAVRKIRQLVSSGELGHVYSFDSVRVNLGLLQPDVNVLWDLGPHDFSILEYVLDDSPASVLAVGADPLAYSSQGLQSVVYVIVKLASGALAHFHLSWLSPVKIRRTLIGGSRRMLVYDHLDPDHQIKLYDKGVDISDREDQYSALVQYRVGDMHAPKVDQTEALETECRHFIACCRGEEQPLTGIDSGIRVVQVLEAAQRSLETGRVVAIPVDET